MDWQSSIAAGIVVITLLIFAVRLARGGKGAGCGHGCGPGCRKK